MAFQDTAGYVAGTAITWTGSGGTFAINTASLAAGSAVQGAKSATLVQVPPGGSTAVLPDFLQFKLSAKPTSTPVAKDEISLCLGFSDSATAGTDNPGGLTGTSTTGPNADVLPQLVLAGALVLSNTLGAVIQTAYLAKVPPLDICVCPVVYNGQATIAMSATANDTTVTMTPYYRERQT